MNMRVYITLMLLASVNYSALANQEFTYFEQKGKQEYLAGFVKCTKYGATQVPGLQNHSESATLGDLSLEDYWYLKRRKKLIVKVGLSGDYDICSRNDELVKRYVSGIKKLEQQHLYKFGHQLRANTLNIFPKNSQQEVSVSLLNQETGSFEKAQRASLERGGSMGISLPAIVLGVEIYDQNVSNEELGYVGSKMLQDPKDHEVVTQRYAIKMTVLEEGQSGSLPSLYDLLAPRQQ